MLAGQTLGGGPMLSWGVGSLQGGSRKGLLNSLDSEPHPGPRRVVWLPGRACHGGAGAVACLDSLPERV